MSEIFFVFKCLVVAIVITFFMQLKVGKTTVEHHAYNFIQTSSLTSHLQDVSAGGVLLIQQSYYAAKKFVENKFQLNESQKNTSRLNFELKRATNE